MSNPGHLTLPEISSQAEAIADVLRSDAEVQAWARRYFGAASYDEVIFIGSGSSYYQAIQMAVTFQAWLGCKASAYPSSDILLFGERLYPKGSYLLVGVSRSGESSEVLLAVEAFKGRAGWTLCGVTCHADSSMAKLCDCAVSKLGAELSTVMTKSLSSMIYLIQRAVAGVSGQAGYGSQLEATASRAASVTERSQKLAEGLIGSHDFNKFVYLGMAGYYGLAQEGCLKLKEMSNVWTESFGTLEFRHGPKSIVDPGTFLCVLVSETARGYELKVAEEMKAYGAYVLLVVAEAGEDTAFADEVLELGGKDADDDARAVLYLPVMQYIGYYQSMKLGLDPDHPRNLTQVVKI